MGGGSFERYTTYAIFACPETYKQADLIRTWFMHLLWPCELKLRDQHLSCMQSRYPSLPWYSSLELIDHQIRSPARPRRHLTSCDNTLISDITATFQRRSEFKSNFPTGQAAPIVRRVVSSMWALHSLKRVAGARYEFFCGSITPCLLHQIALHRHMFQSQCGISFVVTSQERPKTLLKI